MGKSLREQLLEAGLGTPRATPAREKGQSSRAVKRTRGRQGGQQSAKRPATKPIPEESPKARQVLKSNVRRLVRSQQLNVPDAEVAYHFVVGNLVKRLYVTEEQHRSLCAGALAIAVVGQRSYVIALPTAEQLLALDPNAVVVRARPEVGSGGSGNDGVPDDLLW